MKTLLMVHGAYHGSWCWRPLVNLLKTEKLNIVTPTLTGMGERSHLLTPTLSLQVHIDDIANIIRLEELNDIVLLGHSYAGLIIPAINEIFADRISTLVFLDSYIPENAKTGLELVGDDYAQSLLLQVQNRGQGWKRPVSEKLLDIFGVEDSEIRQLLMRKMTDFSLNFMKTPIFLSEHFNSVKKYYIRCNKPSYMGEHMLPYYQKAKKSGWNTFEIAADHEPMLTQPQVLAELLMPLLK